MGLFSWAAKYTTVAVISSAMYPTKARASRVSCGEENKDFCSLSEQATKPVRMGRT
jgi:hypothetical protein